MRRTKSRILSIVLAMVMMVTLAVPAMAAETTTEFALLSDSNLATDNALEKVSDLEMGIRSGRVVVTGLEVYGYRSSDNMITTSPVASGYWTANTFPNVTVPLSKFQDCDNFGCDYWVVYMAFTAEGTPNRLAIYVNDSQMVNQPISAGSYTWNYSVPFSRLTQQFRITLDGDGSSAFGNIYIG